MKIMLDFYYNFIWIYKTIFYLKRNIFSYQSGLNYLVLIITYKSSAAENTCMQ